MPGRIEETVAIPDALRHIPDVLNPLFEQVMDTVADAYVSLYKDAITYVGAVLSGRFRDTVHVRAAMRYDNVIERQIGSDVSYSGVVEYGWIWRARGQQSYPGRYPALLAISRGGQMIKDAFDTQITRFAMSVQK